MTSMISCFRSKSACVIAVLGFSAAVLTLSAPASLASPASNIIVLGDSIGVGLSMASGAPRLAHNSVRIRGGEDAIEQIQEAPPSSVAVLSLGTNDAVGNIGGIEVEIDRIVAAAKEAGTRLVWVGPPCVFKSWNSNVEKLDQILRVRLAAHHVTYVSIADPEVCNRDLRGGDGVHFNMRGYRQLWALTAAALNR